ncbi:MAG: hypothetical protein HY848_00555 [Betaproteobacteria bacterium]|nr:hypothetical protein [Betaproteobacteria bacterium]
MRCGHDHRRSVTQVANVNDGKPWLVNPGAIGGLARNRPGRWAMLRRCVSILSR